MNLNEMTEDQANQVRDELNPKNRNGMLYRILAGIDETFGDDGHWYAIDPEGLTILSGDLYHFQDCYMDREGIIIPTILVEEDRKEYFNFDKDVCNVYELIRRSVVRETIPEEDEPILVVEAAEVITTIKYMVEEYLNKKEE